MSNNFNVSVELSKGIEGLSDIERNLLNALLAGLNTLDAVLTYEVLADEDEEVIEFREIGIHIHCKGNLIAEVYCAEHVSGLTSEYQVTTFGEGDSREILLLPNAVSKIENEIA